MASHISDLVHRISNSEPGVEAERDDDIEAVFGDGTDNHGRKVGSNLYAVQGEGRHT